MKKILSLAFVLVLLLGVCACNNGGSTADNSDDGKSKDNQGGTQVAIPERPKGFDGSFLYSTAEGTFLYKPETNEIIQIGDEEYVEGGVLLNDGKALLVSLGDKLCYRDLGNRDVDIVLGNENTEAFRITDDCKYAFYVADNKLYKNELGTDNNTEIAHNVNDFVISGDGSTIIYSTNDSKLYYFDKVATLIGEDLAGSTEYISADLKTVVCSNSNGLIIFTADNGSKVIEDYYDDVYVINENNIYTTGPDDFGLGAIVHYDGMSYAFIGEIVMTYARYNDKLYFVENGDQDHPDTYAICIANGRNVIRTEVGDVSYFEPSKNGNFLFYIENNNLYKIPVGTDFGTPTLLHENVNFGYSMSVGDSIVYTTDMDYDNYTCKLYIDGTLLSENGSYASSALFSDKFFFYQDNGTIYRYENGQSTLVCHGNDEMENGVFPLADGTAIYFEVDTSDDNDQGMADLYYWNKSELKEITKNATGFGYLYTINDIKEYEIMGDLSVYIPEGDDYFDDDEESNVPDTELPSNSTTLPDLDVDDNSYSVIDPETGDEYVYDEHGNLLYIIKATTKVPEE